MVMQTSATKSFTATLERLPGALHWVIIRIPFDVKKTWKKMNRLRVIGELNGFSFRTSLFPFRQGGHFLLVNRKLQAQAGVAAGSKGRFTIEPDLTERIAKIPKELSPFLNEDKTFRKWYDALPYSHRNEIAKWIEDPETPAARARRGEQMAERLLAAMEGERELPPILKAAFARNGRARAGWEKMTLAQRRRNLLAIFYYQSPDARARRLEKIVEEAEQRFERSQGDVESRE
jgi:uncharacterized protein YdeI (YjbR/CyaY-like superfamily)